MHSRATPGSATTAPRPERREWMLAGVVALSLLILRWFSAHNQPWGSDEPQHLHVVWAWANGLLPYRDVFDNHTPLFHLLYSPLFRYLGERPDILEPMRLAVLPLFVISIACIYRLGARLFSPRAGLWGALFAALQPLFFYRMAEFRTDVLWATLWLVTLVVLLDKPPEKSLSRRRLFVAGVLFGATFAVSMKSVLLLGVALMAGGLLLLRFRHEPRPPLRAVALNVAAALGGFLLVPALLLGFFAWHGALEQLFYCVVSHNTIPGEQSPTQLFYRTIEFPHPLLFLAGFLTALLFPLFNKGEPRLKAQLFLLLIVVLFYPTLHSFWPEVTAQNNLPWYPLVMLCIAPAVLWLVERFRLPAPALLALLLVGQGAWMWHEYEASDDGNRSRVKGVALALQLTREDEFLMDAKGETIFRHRPYYYVLESITCKRLSLGLLPDELPAKLIESRTAVVHLSRRMTEASRAFVKENYISTGKYHILGKPLKKAPTRILIPGEYVVIGEDGPVSARLNGEPFESPRWLDAGEYAVEVDIPNGSKAALIWARAASLGLSPFEP